MLDTRDMETAAPRMAAPEVLMPMESKAEVDRIFEQTAEADAVEQQIRKAFLQGMKFQRTLFAAAMAYRAGA